MTVTHQEVPQVLKAFVIELCDAYPEDIGVDSSQGIFPADDLFEGHSWATFQVICFPFHVGSILLCDALHGRWFNAVLSHTMVVNLA